MMRGHDTGVPVGMSNGRCHRHRGPGTAAPLRSGMVDSLAAAVAELFASTGELDFDGEAQ